MYVTDECWVPSTDPQWAWGQGTYAAIVHDFCVFLEHCRNQPQGCRTQTVSGNVWFRPMNFFCPLFPTHIWKIVSAVPEADSVEDVLLSATVGVELCCWRSIAYQWPFGTHIHKRFQAAPFTSKHSWRKATNPWCVTCWILWNARLWQTWLLGLYKPSPSQLTGYCSLPRIVLFWNQ